MRITIADEYLFNLHFADDQAVIAHDAFADYTVHLLNAINVRKTEYLVNNSNGNFDALIEYLCQSSRRIQVFIWAY